MNGFDYRTQQPTSLPADEWRRQASAEVAAGGFRRVENNETFIHGKDGRILFEVYGNVVVRRPSNI